MKRLVSACLGLLALVGGASAQSAAQLQSGTPVAQRLRDGYEIKAAFFDNNGGAYILLQRGTSAYMCHSSPNQICEKLN